MDYLTKFVNIIMAFIKYVQDLVAYIRAKNDGNENAQQPEFPTF